MGLVNLPRLTGAGLLLAGFALLSAACGGVKNPEGWASPAIDSSAIYYFPDKDRVVSATLAADGTASRAWSFPDKNKQGQRDIKFKAVYDAAIEGETLYFGSWDEHLYAVNAKTGEVQWSTQAGIDGGLVGGPVVAGDALVFGTTDGRLYAVNRKDGSTFAGWPSNGLLFSDGIWAPPVVAEGAAGDRIIYVATMGGEVHALKLSDRSAVWPKPFKVAGAIGDLAILDAGHLFVPSLDKHVYIVDTATGLPVGKGLKADDWVWTSPAFRDGIAYFGDFSGKVYALDITKPEVPRWTYDANSKVKAAPVLVGDVLIVATREPDVHFINAADGVRRGNVVPIDGAGTVRAGLVVRDGLALIATTRGRLYQADPTKFQVTELVVAGENP